MAREKNDQWLTAQTVLLRFLLHYVSRDEVAVLSRGTGGVPEVRNAVDNYADASPLYGFLQYRRRKVVLSYLPEDLSRLVKGMCFAWACLPCRTLVPN